MKQLARPIPGIIQGVGIIGIAVPLICWLLLQLPGLIVWLVIFGVIAWEHHRGSR